MFESQAVYRAEAPADTAASVLELVGRYQMAKQEYEHSRQVTAKSEAMMVSIEKQLKDAIRAAYENDEAMRVLVQTANITLGGIPVRE